MGSMEGWEGMWDLVDEGSGRKKRRGGGIHPSNRPSPLLKEREARATSRRTGNGRTCEVDA